MDCDASFGAVCEDTKTGRPYSVLAGTCQSILKPGDILHVCNMAVCARRCD